MAAEKENLSYEWIWFNYTQFFQSWVRDPFTLKGWWRPLVGLFSASSFFLISLATLPFSAFLATFALARRFTSSEKVKQRKYNTLAWHIYHLTINSATQNELAYFFEPPFLTGKTPADRMAAFNALLDAPIPSATKIYHTTLRSLAAFTDCKVLHDAVQQKQDALFAALPSHVEKDETRNKRAKALIHIFTDSDQNQAFSKIKPTDEQQAEILGHINWLVCGDTLDAQKKYVVSISKVYSVLLKKGWKVESIAQALAGQLSFIVTALSKSVAEGALPQTLKENVESLYLPLFNMQPHHAYFQRVMSESFQAFLKEVSKQIPGEDPLLATSRLYAELLTLPNAKMKDLVQQALEAFLVGLEVGEGELSDQPDEQIAQIKDVNDLCASLIEFWKDNPKALLAIQTSLDRVYHAIKQLKDSAELKQVVKSIFAQKTALAIILNVGVEKQSLQRDPDPLGTQLMALQEIRLAENPALCEEAIILIANHYENLLRQCKGSKDVFAKIRDSILTFLRNNHSLFVPPICLAGEITAYSGALFWRFLNTPDNEKMSGLFLSVIEMALEHEKTAVQDEPSKEAALAHYQFLLDLFEMSASLILPSDKTGVEKRKALFETDVSVLVSQMRGTKEYNLRARHLLADFDRICHPYKQDQAQPSPARGRGLYIRLTELQGLSCSGVLSAASSPVRRRLTLDVATSPTKATESQLPLGVAAANDEVNPAELGSPRKLYSEKGQTAGTAKRLDAGQKSRHVEADPTSPSNPLATFWT